MTDAAPVNVGSPFLRTSLVFGAEPSSFLFVADLFAGREPQRIDAAAAAGAESEIGFRPTVLLDSQAVTYLHQFVSGSSRLPSPRREIVETFLKFAVAKGLDYNPAFYFLEALRRDDDASAEYAFATARSILRLHTMSKQEFLTTGRLHPDPVALAPYQTEFGLETFDDIAAAYANAFVREARGHDLATSGAGRLSYAVLLTIAAIHRSRPGTGPRDIVWKCARFDEYLGALGIGLAFERVVAIQHFAGGIDNFLPVQKGANPERALARIRAAAWDIELLRVPATWLALPPEHGVIVAYPCTADRTLALLAQSFTLELVCVAGGTRPIFPVYKLSDPQLREFARKTRVLQQHASRTTEIGEGELSALIRDAEAEVRRACCD